MLLELHGVWCRWRQRLSILQAHDLPTYLRLEEGEWLALLGSNGVGKTTLLRAIAGLGIYSGGVIRVDGRSLTGGDITARFQAGVAYVGQEPALKNSRMLWSDAVAVATAMRPGLRNDGAIADLKTMCASAGLIQHEQVRGRVFDLIVAVLCLPRLLILDEIGKATREVAPTLNVYELLRHLLPRAGVIFVEHDIKTAIRAANKILLMRPPGEDGGALPEPPIVLSTLDPVGMKLVQDTLGEFGEERQAEGGADAGDVLSEWDSPRAVIAMALKACVVSREARATLLREWLQRFKWMASGEDVGALSGGQRVMLARILCAAVDIPFAEQQLRHVDQQNQDAIAEALKALHRGRRAAAAQA